MMTTEQDRIRWIGVGMIGFAGAAAIALRYLPAAYGRYSDASFGPLVNARVAWMVQESPCLLWVAMGVWGAREGRSLGAQDRVLLGMFAGHYVQRTLIYPLLLRGGKPTPLSVAALAAVFCVFNGYLQVQPLTSGQRATTPPWQFAAGLALFAAGMAINLHSDRVLRNLRQPGETDYKIPYGGLFRWVSGANFFGEIVEWTGYAVAYNALPGWAFAIFTASNIGPRALQHHQWYLQHFKESYQKLHRKALIPYLL